MISFRVLASFQQEHVGFGAGNDTNEEDDERLFVLDDSSGSTSQSSWMRSLHHAQIAGHFDSKHLLIARLLRFREHTLAADHFRSQVTSVAWQPNGRKQLIAGTAHGSLSVFTLNPDSSSSASTISTTRNDDHGRRPVRTVVRQRQARAKPSANEQLIAHWPGKYISSYDHMRS
jgi:WD40 repeat protein